MVRTLIRHLFTVYILVLALFFALSSGANLASGGWHILIGLLDGAMAWYFMANAYKRFGSS